MTLYEKLQNHFNDAIAREPRHAFAFREELSVYKGALLDKNQLCQEILRLKSLPGGEESCRPPEVVSVFREGFKIYNDYKGRRA